MGFCGKGDKQNPMNWQIGKSWKNKCCKIKNWIEDLSSALCRKDKSFSLNQASIWRALFFNVSLERNICHDKDTFWENFWRRLQLFNTHPLTAHWKDRLLNKWTVFRFQVVNLISWMKWFIQNVQIDGFLQRQNNKGHN